MIRSFNQVVEVHCGGLVSVSQNEQQFYRTAITRNSRPFAILLESTVPVLQRIIVLGMVFLSLGIGSMMAINQVSHAHKVQTESAAIVKYVVQPGDTLWGIASEKEQTGNLESAVQKIESFNHLDDNSNIYPGQVLQIPGGRD